MKEHRHKVKNVEIYSYCIAADYLSYKHYLDFTKTSIVVYFSLFAWILIIFSRLWKIVTISLMISLLCLLSLISRNCSFEHFIEIFNIFFNSFPYIYFIYLIFNYFFLLILIKNLNQFFKIILKNYISPLSFFLNDVVISWRSFLLIFNWLPDTMLWVFCGLWCFLHFFFFKWEFAVLLF